MEYSIVIILQSTFTQQQQACYQQPFPSFAQRKQQLKQLRVAILANKSQFIDAISVDFGHRAPQETLLAEIFPIVKEVDYVLKHLKKWMKPQRRKVSMIFQPASNQVVAQPKGVVGIIVPWNYPLFLAISPLIYAIAGGNRVMIKISEDSPQLATVLAQVLSSIFSEEEVSVVMGDAQVADAFSRLPFDHLLFTGSTPIGKKVMANASQSLTPVTLELGGKSPVIIEKGYPLQKAAKILSFTKSLNAGQTCVAPDYVLVHKDDLLNLAYAIKNAFIQQYPQFTENPQYTHIINQLHFERLQGYLAEIDTKHIIQCGETTGRKMPLHIVVDPPMGCQLMQEEIFGAILPLVSYNTIDEALEMIRQRPRPLACYAMTYNARLQQRIIQEIHAGGMCFNDAVMHVAQTDLPFGGIGASGMGAYHGKEGFDTFTHHKPIFKRGRIHSGMMLYPPYKGLFDKFMRLFLR